MTTPLDGGFRCDVHPDRDRVVVRPIGELDLATVPLLETPLREMRSSGFKRLILDLRQVTFLDSTGLRLLIAWAAGAEQDGYALGIVADSTPVRRLLELTGAHAHLPLVSAREADTG